MPEDFSSMLEMAGSLQSLKHAMANQGISCGMAQDSCAGRDERWTDMDRLSEYCTQQLKGWQLAENRRKAHAVLDSLGWMEVHFRPEKHLILTGLNEGDRTGRRRFRPVHAGGTEGSPGHRFLQPEKSPGQLPADRPAPFTGTGGSLTIILSRTSSKNDPLTPSSLLMRCPDAELPHRVEQLFREISDPPAPLPYQRGSWYLQPAEGWKAATDIGAMAPGYKKPVEGKRASLFPLRPQKGSWRAPCASG